MSRPAIVWFQQDLRLADNPALDAACRQGGEVVCVYVWAPGEEDDWPPGGASRVWLHHALADLAQELRARGARLLLRQGPPAQALRELQRECRASAVFWNRRYEPGATERERGVARALGAAGAETRSFNAGLLWEPDEVANAAGKPYRVFTPFWKQYLRMPAPAAPLPAPQRIPGAAGRLASVALDGLGLLPARDWAGGLTDTWDMRGSAAREALDAFVDEALMGYPETRDLPGVDGVSRLSPYLHFGAIGPREIWHSVSAAGPAHGAAAAFLRQIAWREFAHHLLVHFPHTTTQPMNDSFTRFPWRRAGSGARELQAWREGRTGYPLVDAGMRQLWATGWMHNRVRMVVASFLVKHLLQHWLQGARWFWDTLVDADLANNTMGWQWTAGCGADAAPYFRIFNPVTQGERFDPDGRYVRTWVPELTALPNRLLHRPWEAPARALERAGLRAGKDYPRPIVDHAEARNRALRAYERMRSTAS